MPDFEVRSQALHSGSASIQGVGDSLSNSASSMTPPDSMMMGIFMAPFLSAVLPVLTNMLKDVVDGSGKSYAGVANNLADTAAAYDATEESHKELIQLILKEMS